MYTGPQSHYTEQKIDKKEPEWLYERPKITGQDTVGREESAKEKDILKQEATKSELEPSEEDPLIYIVGDEDNKNPPQCILGIASVDQYGETYILSRNEEQRLKNLVNGSNEDDSESSDAEETDDDNREDDDDDQPACFEAGHSRSGRRVTRYFV